MQETAAVQNSIAEFGLPKVSVVISNFNYAAYLPQCVESVFNQTYSEFECIIVDDASQDDSRRVIDELKTKFASLIVIFNQLNVGQAASALTGLKASSGHYVLFLDADDVLMPNALVTHVYAQLSLRLPVGFSCADMLQINQDVLMGTGFITLNEFVLAHPQLKIEPRESLQEVLPAPAFVSPQLLMHLYSVKPETRGWPWSATSAMMFRRDALRFWEDAQGLAALRHSIDAFFCFGVNALCGSILIDMPLAGYRIHGRNGFAARLPLSNVRNHLPNSPGERSAHALQLLLDHMESERVVFRDIVWSDQHYDRIVASLRQNHHDLRRKTVTDNAGLLDKLRTAGQALLANAAKRLR